MAVEDCISIWPILNCNRCNHRKSVAFDSLRWETKCSDILLGGKSRQFCRRTCRWPGSWKINERNKSAFVVRLFIPVICFYNSVLTWTWWENKIAFHRGNNLLNTIDLHSSKASSRLKKCKLSISDNWNSRYPFTFLYIRASLRVRSSRIRYK